MKTQADAQCSRDLEEPFSIVHELRPDTDTARGVRTLRLKSIKLLEKRRQVDYHS